MITIVGHGRSAEGKGLGERIDTSRLVIRMWNCEWQTPVDHGTKYDWGLMETHKRLMSIWRQKATKEPACGWLVSILDKYHDWQDEVPPRSILIKQSTWLTEPFAQALGGAGESGKWHLSRGGIAAAWAIENAEGGETIVLVGFDNLLAQIFLPEDVAFSEVYKAHPQGCWIYPGYHSGKTKFGNHDIVAERLLLEEMARRRGVQLAFAQDVWQ